MALCVRHGGGWLPRAWVGGGLESGFDLCGLCFVAGFFEECKHVAFVVFDAGLVEGVDSEDVA